MESEKGNDFCGLSKRFEILSALLTEAVGDILETTFLNGLLHLTIKVEVLRQRLVGLDEIIRARKPSW